MNLGAIGFPRWLSLRLRGQRIESAPSSPAIKLTWRNRSTWANSFSSSRTWWEGRPGRPVCLPHAIAHGTSRRKTADSASACSFSVEEGRHVVQEGIHLVDEGHMSAASKYDHFGILHCRVSLV